MTFRSSRWALFTSFFLTFPALAQRQTETYHGHEVAAHQVIVRFASADAQTRSQAEFAEDVDQSKKLNAEGIVRMHSRSKSAETMIADLQRRSDVVYAEPDYVVHAVGAPNDPAYGQLWAMKNTGQAILGYSGKTGADIGAEAAWNVTTGTKDVVVGVVDTGTDYTHPDLAANIWNNPNGVAGCAAGTHGYNAIAASCDPMDDQYHGTHVSGTIGAVGNNSVGVVGVNWTTSIMPLKFLDSTGGGVDSDAVIVIEFAIQAKIAGTNVRVLSNSWGGSGFSQALLDEINKANSYDILFVAAAGNSSSDDDVTPTYPANYNSPNIIAVAATDNSDQLASFSDYGATTVHLGAPGVAIYSTQPGNNYQYMSGTSMATPHVAGAAALILSRSTLTTAQLKQTILSNVDPDPNLSGKTITGGRLNVCKAIPGCGASQTVADFSLSIGPSSATLPGTGGSTSFSVAVSGSGGFTAPVNFTVSGLPTGMTASFSAASSTAGTTLSLSTNPNVAAGTYSVTVTGSGGSPAMTHTIAASVVVQSAASSTVTWTKVAMEGDTVFLPKGTTYRFGIGTSWLAPVTTTADWTVYVYYTNMGGDPAPGVRKELDVEGSGAGVVVDGVAFASSVP